MAVTKIWPIHSGASIKVVIDYIKNADKTDRLRYTLKIEGKTDYTETEINAMEDVTDFVTENGEGKERYLVSGINVSPETAREDMMTTKKHYGKADGIILWHGYQSFQPGEVTPDEAHTIGVELAKSMWGNNYEVVVSTHIDRAHIHNHFVVNSVSFRTGKKLDGKWQEMKRESDRLCEIYGKGVIREPDGRGRSYGEYVADKENRFTWKSAIRKEVDEIIDCSKSMEDFFSELRKRGYYVKTGKYLTLRPPGKERGMRIDRILGTGYSVDGIAKRIEANVAQGKVHIIPVTKKYRAMNVKKPRYRITGIQALFYFYCYKLGVYEKTGIKSRSGYLYREDLRKIRVISNETLFISRNKIENTEDLEMMEAVLRNEIKALAEKRDSLKEGRKEINDRLRIKRKELWYCRDIRERSKEINDKREKSRQLEYAGKEKEAGR